MIDASRVLAGPFATMLLADLGADVVKVEPPEGDETRAWGPPWWGDPADRRSAYFASVNRNKRSVVLDLRTDAGRADLDRLLADADLLVHNYRPRTAARLGLEADALRVRHPSLVVATVGGFPGADADRPAYDLLAQAVSGLMSVTGDPDGPPTKVGVALLDLIAGLECAVGALAALVGRGSVGTVEVSLVETGVTSLINVLGNHLATGEVPMRHGNAHPNIAPYEAFEARRRPPRRRGRQRRAVRPAARCPRPRGRRPRYATNPMRIEAQPRAGWRGLARRSRSGRAATCSRPSPPPMCPPARSTRFPRRWPRSATAGSRPSTASASLRTRSGSTASVHPLRLAPPRLGEHTDEVLGRA